MKKQAAIIICSLASLFLFTQVVSAQSKKEKIKEEIFSSVDSVPQFVGGREALAQFITSNMEFPAKANKNGIKKGKVYVQFIVKKDGNIVNCEIEKTTDDVFNKEAIRLVELMPTWNAAILNGKQVNSRHTLAIKFGYTSVLDSK